MRPQRCLFQRAVAEYLGRRPQRRIGVQHRIGQSLEQMRFLGPDTKVMQLDVCLSPGQRQGTFKHSSGHCTWRLTPPRRSRAGPTIVENTMCTVSPWRAHALCGASSSPDRARARRYSRAAAHRSSKQAYGHGARVRETARDPFHIAGHLWFRLRLPPPGQPTPPLPHRSPAARGDQRADLRHEFRLNKEIRKEPVGHIGGLRRQRQLGVRGDLQIVARSYPHIGHGDAPHFSIILGRHHHLRASC